jgi:very-short-patch-repair endonuclease
MKHSKLLSKPICSELTSEAILFRSPESLEDCLLQRRTPEQEGVLLKVINLIRDLGISVDVQDEVFLCYGDYVLRSDLLILSRVLAVEVDGPIHQSEQQREIDSYKNRAYQGLGFKVVRVTHENLMPENIQVTLETVKQALNCTVSSKERANCRVKMTYWRKRMYQDRPEFKRLIELGQQVKVPPNVWDEALNRIPHMGGWAIKLRPKRSSSVSEPGSV